MKKISKNNYYNTAINKIASSMTEEEYAKAREFYKFLVSITKRNHGILSIHWDQLIDFAATFMKCTPWEAYNILKKMRSYGWITTLDKDYITVNLEKEI
jgi:hypothetical protein